MLRVQIAEHGSQLTWDHSRAMVRELGQRYYYGVTAQDPDIRQLSPLLDGTATLHRPLVRFSNRKAAILIAAFNVSIASAASDKYGAAYHTMPPTTAAITSWGMDGIPRVFLH